MLSHIILLTIVNNINILKRPLIYIIDIMRTLMISRRISRQSENNLRLQPKLLDLQSGRLRRSRDVIEISGKTASSFPHPFPLIDLLLMPIFVCLRHDRQRQAQWKGEGKS